MHSKNFHPLPPPPVGMDDVMDLVQRSITHVTGLENCYARARTQRKSYHFISVSRPTITPECKQCSNSKRIVLE